MVVQVAVLHRQPPPRPLPSPRLCIVSASAPLVAYRRISDVGCGLVVGSSETGRLESRA